MSPNPSAVVWFLSSDATATTNRLGIQKHSNGNFIIGLDHNYDKCAALSTGHDPNQGPILDSGLINGLSAVSQLEEDGHIQRASLANVLILVPLIQDSFHYGLLTFPVGSFCDHKSLYELYERIVKLARTLGIHIVSLVGDGDSRLRKIQNTYGYHSTTSNFLTELVFPLVLGFGSLWMDIPMQDFLHCLKKLLNQLKYLTTRAIIMCATSNLTTENRLKYSVGWELVYLAWETSDDFRDAVSRSAVILNDKQNPALAAEISFTYGIFYQLGYNSMGLYLECINLLMLSFLDRRLTPVERLRSVGCVKAVFTLWREASDRDRSLTAHFITKQTYSDVTCAIEGLIMYIYKISVEYPDNDIVPWFFSSDPCEMAFAYMRTAHHMGRQTNLDGKDVCKGLERKNRSLALDTENIHLIEHDVAHTRGQSLIPDQKGCAHTVFKGRDVKLKDIKLALNEGAEWGRILFEKYSHYESNEEKQEEYDDEWETASTDIETDTEDTEHDKELSDMVDHLNCDTNTMECNVDGNTYHIDYAVQKYCNGGRTTLGAQARKRRFYKKDITSKVNLEGRIFCPLEDRKNCKVLTVSDKFICSLKKQKKGCEATVYGEVMYATCNTYASSGSKSSVSSIPTKTVCLTHDLAAVFWVKTEDGHLVPCDNFLPQNS